MRSGNYMFWGPAWAHKWEKELWQYLQQRFSVNGYNNIRYYLLWILLIGWVFINYSIFCPVAINYSWRSQIYVKPFHVLFENVLHNRFRKVHVCFLIEYIFRNGLVFVPGAKYLLSDQQNIRRGEYTKYSHIGRCVSLVLGKSLGTVPSLMPYLERNALYFISHFIEYCVKLIISQQLMSFIPGQSLRGIIVLLWSLFDVLLLWGDWLRFQNVYVWNWH